MKLSSSDPKIVVVNNDRWGAVANNFNPAPEVGEQTRTRERLPDSVSCVIPCKNEADNLAVLLERLSTVLLLKHAQWEIIVVDDGSTDSTPELMNHWTQNPGFRYVQLSRNFGKEAALMAGLNAARGEVIITMDADLQHSPAMVDTFIQKWRDGFDVAFATRVNRAGEHLVKRAGVSIFYRLVNGASRFEVPSGASDFRLMDRAVVNALIAMPERKRFMKGLYAWVGFKSIAIPYEPERRGFGGSHFSAIQLLALAFDGLTAFTTWPLRAVSMIGFVLASWAIAYGTYLTVSYFAFGNGVSGWTTITVSLMLFSGIQLISLGVVGEYVGRIFEEVKARPMFVVKHTSGQGMTADTGHKDP